MEDTLANKVMSTIKKADRPTEVSIQQLRDMVAISLEDGILTDDEKNLLCGMAKTLGIEKSELEFLLKVKLEEEPINQSEGDIERLAEPSKQALLKSLSASVGNAVSKAKTFSAKKCLPIAKYSKNIGVFVSTRVSKIKDSQAEQKELARIQLEALLTKIRDRRKQSKILKEKEKTEIKLLSISLADLDRRIANIEHARRKRHSLLKNQKDSSVAENELKVLEKEESVLTSAKETILTIPKVHARKLDLSKLLKRINHLMETTIFDETKEEKSEKALLATAGFAAAAAKGLGDVAKEAAKNSEIQKATFDLGVTAWKSRKDKTK